MALSVSQLAAITHRLILPKAVDNIFASNPLLMRMKEKGRRYDSGRTIVQPIVYDDVNAVQEYEGAEVLSTEINDNITAAEFNWRQYSALFGVTGREEIINDGAKGILNLLKMKQKVTEVSLLNKLGTDLQGTNSTGKRIDGLGLMLDDTTTSYGGISSTDFSGWVATVHALAVAGTLTLFEMQKMFGAVTISGDHPTVIVTKQQVYDKIWSILQPDQRFIDAKMGEAGFGGLKFNGIPIVVDSHVSGSGYGTADNFLQMLNEAYLDLVTHSRINFKVAPIPQTKDQDMKLVRIFWAGNLVCSARRMHAVVETINPTL